MSIKHSVLSIVVFVSFSVTAQFWNISEVKRLPGTVNTEVAEESIPVFSKDSSMLYFVRTYDPKAEGGEYDQDIWFSRKSGDGYTDCQLLKSINNKYNNAVIGLNANGSNMYVLNTYEGKKDLVKGLAVSAADGADWGKPVEIVIPTLDIEGDFYGFHVNRSEDIILISYAGPNSVGLEDLYVSKKQGGTWSAPINMGNVLNTASFEISPFLNKTSDTLFFSSEGHGGMGGADIFYSVRLDDSWTNWSKPVNLGNKINSPKFDAYFSYTTNQIYWSSNRDGERSDIYMATVLYPPPLSVSCKGIDITKYGANDGRLESTPKGGVGKITYSWTNNSKEQNPFGVAKGEYTVTAKDELGQTATCTCRVNEPLPPVVEDLQLKHYFEYNGDKLTVEEGKLLDFVSKLETQITNGRQKVTINIWSSASYVPTKTFATNDKLARSRANRIKNELTAYFKSKNMADKVTIKIVSAVVQGPKYEKDFENTAKYHDFQYIELKTE
ncbi:MAG: SprB repeat-containing protein [Cryomorphaceae bacterium]|jgi:hypothetical protein|nr:SprB repeat-containing protein [Cryomorphaceae bacterium]